MFGQNAADIPYPKNAVLWVHVDIYNWKANYLNVLCALHLRDYDIAQKYYFKLLNFSTEIWHILPELKSKMLALGISIPSASTILVNSNEHLVLAYFVHIFLLCIVLVIILSILRIHYT